jgi:hypothetical protein
MISRDNRLLAPTRFVSTAVVPVLGAAFVILYLFPGETMRLWGWMVCPHMSAYVLGGGYLAGAYLFTRAARSGGWHQVSVGFVATTAFSTMLLAVTIWHWDTFNHGHVSFWAWLLLYVATPVLLPWLWSRNQRTDPQTFAAVDTEVPRRLRTATGIGGALQLAIAAAMFLWPDSVVGLWPWATDVTTLRVISAFVAFPAVTWLWFLFEHRWSSFRITQQTVTIGLVLTFVGTLRSRTEFRSESRFWLYVSLLMVALGLNVALYVAMERRAARRYAEPVADANPKLRELVLSA